VDGTRLIASANNNQKTTGGYVNIAGTSWPFINRTDRTVSVDFRHNTETGANALLFDGHCETFTFKQLFVQSNKYIMPRAE